MQRRRQALALIAVSAALSLVGAARRAWLARGPDRAAALRAVLAARGLLVDPSAIVWLERPPIPFMRAAAGSVPVVVRARAVKDEPYDIYLCDARLSPEGVLLSVGRTHNVSDTSATDELRPVASGRRFAYADERGVVRLVDLGGEPAAARAGWTRLERLQAAVTRWQDTGRARGIARYVYSIVPEPKALSIAMTATTLDIAADGRTARVPLSDPLQAPEWLGAEQLPESAPGNLVTWAVDRVRGEVGEEAMQYVKAIAFSALDVLKSGREKVESDKQTAQAAADDIAADLGQQDLAEPVRAIPIDPDIGFPPPPLQPLVTPSLAGEGVWNAKADDPFIHSLPGLPPTFVTTFIRSDRARKTSVTYLALWDPRVVALDMMAGVAEPKSATGATGPGLIPREPTVLTRVCAAMNAGFQALHGEFGMMSDGVVYLPPKPYAATIAQLGDGSTAFGTWPEDPSIPGEMASYRQNMTPMVIDGKFNPYHRTWWGGTPADWEDKTHTVRTGICLTQENFVGYFYGADLSPDALAQAMIAARCHYGLALDMNAGHSGLEFYRVGPQSEIGTLGRPLSWDWEREGDVPEMPGWKFRARRLIRGMGLMNFPRYIKREGRDFFYLTLRYVLPGKPIAAQGGKAGDGQWQVKGLPQHGFPYAMARTDLPWGSARIAVLRLDPRMITASGKTALREKDAPAVVASLVPPGEKSADAPSLWISPTAFAIAPEPLAPGSLRLASATASADGQAAAAIGVEDESGMLVYLEVAGGQLRVSELRSALGKLGCSKMVALRDKWPIALGGDTDLGLRATHLPEGGAVVLFRAAGPGGRRIFEDTPIVPFDKWYPLQARRIRYFKKPKET